MADPFGRGATGGGLAGASPAEKAGIRAIEDLLARSGRIRDVGASAVARVAQKQRLDLEKDLGAARRDLYGRFLRHCLQDGHVSDDESEDLSHLRQLLSLTDGEASQVHEDVAVQVYGRAIDEVLADHRLDPDEEQFLARLRRELQLSDQAAAELLRQGEVRARHRTRE